MGRMRICVNGKTSYVVTGAPAHYVPDTLGWAGRGSNARARAKEMRARYVCVRSSIMRCSLERGVSLAHCLEDCLVDGAIGRDASWTGRIYVPIVGGVYVAEFARGVIVRDEVVVGRDEAEDDIRRMGDRAVVIDTLERGAFAGAAELVQIDLDRLSSYRYRSVSAGFLLQRWPHPKQLRPVVAAALVAICYSGYSYYEDAQRLIVEAQREAEDRAYREQADRHRAHSGPAQFAAFANAVARPGVLPAYGIAEAKWSNDNKKKLTWSGGAWQGADVERLRAFAKSRGATLTLATGGWTLNEPIEWRAGPVGGEIHDLDSWIADLYWGLSLRGIGLRDEGTKDNMGVEEHIYTFTLPVGGADEYAYMLEILRSAPSQCDHIVQRFRDGTPLGMEVVMRLFGRYTSPAETEVPAA